MNILGMFAKHWTPGSVKTRLAKRMGHQYACDIHQHLAEFLYQQLATAGDRRCLSIWPPEYELTIKRHFADHFPAATWQVQIQCQGDLGQKMTDFFQSHFAKGASKCILIGSDCVSINPAMVNKAFERLDQDEVVIGPSRDGGYFLIGLNRPRPEIFENVQWSTSETLVQTLDVLHRRQISFSLLEEKFDVDCWSDLCDLQDMLKTPNSTPAEKQLLKRITEITSHLGDVNEPAPYEI